MVTVLCFYCQHCGLGWLAAVFSLNAAHFRFTQEFLLRQPGWFQTSQILSAKH